MIPGEQIIVLILQIVLEAMRGQNEEQRAKMWDWYIKDVERWRKILKLDQ
jgi:hypothetical protein